MQRSHKLSWFLEFSFQKHLINTNWTGFPLIPFKSLQSLGELNSDNNTERFRPCPFPQPLTKPSPHWVECVSIAGCAQQWHKYVGTFASIFHTTNKAKGRSCHTKIPRRGYWLSAMEQCVLSYQCTIHRLNKCKHWFDNILSIASLLVSTGSAPSDVNTSPIYAMAFCCLSLVIFG